MSEAALGLATEADLAALPDDLRAEIIDGAVEEKAAPTFEHSSAQALLTAALAGPFHRRGGPGGPGGWWIGTEVDIKLEPHQIFRPDISGWRRDRVPERPSGWPITIRPDWCARCYRLPPPGVIWAPSTAPSIAPPCPITGLSIPSTKPSRCNAGRPKATLWCSLPGVARRCAPSRLKPSSLPSACSLAMTPPTSSHRRKRSSPAHRSTR